VCQFKGGGESDPLVRSPPEKKEKAKTHEGGKRREKQEGKNYPGGGDTGSLWGWVDTGKIAGG